MKEGDIGAVVDPPAKSEKSGPWGRRIDERLHRKKYRQEAEEDQRHSTRFFPCPGCGADLRFDPGTANMICAHCGVEAEVPHVDDEAAQLENSYHFYLDKDTGAMAEEEASSIDCRGCGASIEFHPDEHSRICPFCDGAIVGDVRMQRRIVPQGVLPFKLMEKEAHEAMRKWLKSRWFAPNDIADEAKTDHFHGIYVPFWTFDAYTVTNYSGARGGASGRARARAQCGPMSVAT